MVKALKLLVTLAVGFGAGAWWARADQPGSTLREATEREGPGVGIFSVEEIRGYVTADDGKPEPNVRVVDAVPSNVSGPTPAPEPKSGLGATFAVSFDIEDVDQIDFGAAKAPGGVVDTQLVITPVTPAGITAKEIPAKYVKAAGRRGGWGRRRPKSTFHNTIRWPAGPHAAVGPYSPLVGVPDPVGGGGFDEWMHGYMAFTVDEGTNEASAFPAWPESEAYWAHAHHVPSLSALTSPLAESPPMPPVRSDLAAPPSPVVAPPGAPRPTMPAIRRPHGALPPGLRVPADPE